MCPFMAHKSETNLYITYEYKGALLKSINEKHISLISRHLPACTTTHKYTNVSASRNYTAEGKTRKKTARALGHDSQIKNKLNNC